LGVRVAEEMHDVLGTRGRYPLDKDAVATLIYKIRIAP
jgi:hypothetical protein